MRSLGVSLRVYIKDGKWDWTSLLGGEKKVLLDKLPHLFEKFLPPSKIQQTRSLWMVNLLLYAIRDYFIERKAHIAYMIFNSYLDLELQRADRLNEW